MEWSGILLGIFIITMIINLLTVMLQIRRKKYVEGILNLIFYCSLGLILLKLNSDIQFPMYLILVLSCLSAIGLFVNAIYTLNKNKSR